MSNKIAQAVVREVTVLAVRSMEFVQLARANQVTPADFGKFADKALSNLETAAKAIRPKGE